MPVSTMSGPELLDTFRAANAFGLHLQSALNNQSSILAVFSLLPSTISH